MKEIYVHNNINNRYYLVGKLSCHNNYYFNYDNSYLDNNFFSISPDLPLSKETFIYHSVKPRYSWRGYKRYVTNN